MRYLTILILFLSIGLYGQTYGIIKCDPYPVECIVVYNVNYDDLNNALRENGDIMYATLLPEIKDYFTEYAFTVTLDDHTGFPAYYMVFTQEISDSLDDYNTVGHEVIHLMQYLFYHYNVDFTTETESSAYLFESLVNQIHDIINFDKK